MKNGVLVIDKPKGITSHDVVLKARKRLHTRKIGHAGTLDPLATGVLLLCLGSATKLSSFLTKEDKEYVATLRLGEETDTFDSEGSVTFRSEEVLPGPNEIESAVKGFQGVSSQVPPMFSAIKKNGVPLYRLARKGIEVEREARRVEIKEIQIKSLSLPELTLRVLCSSGTYIRSLATDIGRELGCGAHLTALTRTKSGEFILGEAVSFEEMESADRAKIEERIIPMASSLKGIPQIEVEEGLETKIRCGVQPCWNDFMGVDPTVFKSGDRIKLLSGDGSLLSIAEVKNETSGKRLKLLRVFN